jgi:hypothetical protein
VTTVTTRIGLAIDTLVALFQTQLPSTITVLDGSTSSMAYPPDWVVVGSAGIAQESESAATSRQRWNGIGAKTRDETVQLTCAVGASSGTVDARGFKPVRDRALATLALMEAALRADPGLGGITMGAVEMTDADLFYEGDGAGIEAALVFTITVPFRLETS